MMVQPRGNVLDEYSALYNTLLTFVRLCGDGAAREERDRRVFCFIYVGLHSSCGNGNERGSLVFTNLINDGKLSCGLE
jgi:hypothetical protein